MATEQDDDWRGEKLIRSHDEDGEASATLKKIRRKRPGIKHGSKNGFGFGGDRSSKFLFGAASDEK